MRTGMPHTRARRAALIGLLFVLGILGQRPAAIWAQDCTRVAQEVESTQRHMEHARNVVRESGSPRALEPLMLAGRLQEQAVNLLQDPSFRNCSRALELTREARKLAERALRIAADQASLEQRALHELQQLERMMEAIRDRADGPLPDRLQRFLAMARRRLEQAREAFHEQRFEEAMSMARDLRRLLEEFGNVAPMGRLEGMFENTRRLLDNTREQVMLGDNAEARMLLERAEQLATQARQNFESGRGPVAERQLQQARDLALRAMRLLERQPDVSQLDAVLEETAAYIDEVARAVRDAAAPEADVLIENAQRHLERAQQMRRDGKLRQSLDEARVARNLARRAWTLIDTVQ